MIEQLATSASRSLLSELPEFPRHGTVHSAFARAVNLTWGDGGWACLLEAPVPLNSRAILLSEVPTAERGERVQVSRNSIVLPESQVRILLDRAVFVDLRLLPAGPWDRHLVHSRTRELRSLCPGMKTDPFGARMNSIIEEIRRVEDEEEAGRRLRSLVGLGNGLTPAGDDFLVGFLAASLFFDVAGVARQSLIDALPEWTRSRTTDVSQRMLDAAVSDEFALPVHRLLESLVRQGNGLHGRARELLEVGESSGADTLAGILFCLEGFVKGQP